MVDDTERPDQTIGEIAAVHQVPSHAEIPGYQKCRKNPRIDVGARIETGFPAEFGGQKLFVPPMESKRSRRFLMGAIFNLSYSSASLKR